MTITRRGLGLTGASLVLWLTARSFGAPELQVAAVAILILLLLAAFRVLLVPGDLRIERIVHPGRLHYGEAGQVILKLTNRSWRPTTRFTFSDRIDGALVPRSAPAGHQPPLRGRRQSEFAYALVGNQRGIFSLGPLSVRFADPFELFARRRTLPGTSSLTVLPKVISLPRGLPLGGGSAETGHGRTRPYGGGEHRSEVRDYVQGDPLRAIHWPSTAHRGKLMVRGDEGPRSSHATILLDVRNERHRDTGHRSSLELAITTAASATAHLVEHGHSVRIVDGRSPGIERPQSLNDWLDHLAETQAGDIPLQSLLSPFFNGATTGTVLMAIVTPPNPAELRALVQVGRRASLKVGILVRSGPHGHHQKGMAAILEDAQNGLRAAGWRVTTVAAEDELQNQWASLLTRRTPATISP